MCLRVFPSYVNTVLSKKKNVLILVEWLHSEMGLAPSVLWQQKSSFTVIQYGHVLLVFFVSTSGTEKKGNSRGRTLGDRLKGASSSSLISLLVHQIANLSYAHWHQSNLTRAGQRWARSHDLHSTKNKKKLKSTHRCCLCCRRCKAGFLCNEGLNVP